jgi:hypothetical protein
MLKKCNFFLIVLVRLGGKGVWNLKFEVSSGFCVLSFGFCVRFKQNKEFELIFNYFLVFNMKFLQNRLERPNQFNSFKPGYKRMLPEYKCLLTESGERVMVILLQQTIVQSFEFWVLG